MFAIRALAEQNFGTTSLPAVAGRVRVRLGFVELRHPVHERLPGLVTPQLREEQVKIYSDDDDDEHEADPELAVALGNEDRYEEHHKREQIKDHPRANLSDVHALIRTLELPLY